MERRKTAARNKKILRLTLESEIVDPLTLALIS
jgi:hypothetical protein